VLKPCALTETQLSAWRSSLAADPLLGSPFLTPSYVQALGRKLDNVFIGVLELGGEPSAFLPYERNSAGIGQRLRLSDCQGLIAKPGTVPDLPRFIRGCGLRAWDFDHLLAAQRDFIPFHRETSASPVMDLSVGYEAYVAERRAAGTEQIKKTYNLMRRLEREHGPLRFDPHLPDPSVLRQLLAWRSSKYQDSRHPVELVTALLEELMKEQHPECSGSLSVLYAGEEVAACHFGLRSRTVWHYWFPAYNPKFEKLSPGNILLLKIAELAPQLGITSIDLGKGGQDYKKRFMNSSVELAAGSITVSPLLSLLRTLRDKARRTPALRALVRRLKPARNASAITGNPVSGPAS